MLRGIDGEWLKMTSEQRTDYKINGRFFSGLMYTGYIYFIQAAMGPPVIAEKCHRHLMRSCSRGQDEQKW